MNQAKTASRFKLDLTSTCFLIVAFLTGIASALQTPTLSLFLSTKIHQSPLGIGIFYMVNAVIGILISQALAHFSDKEGRNRRTLMIYCCLLGAIGCVFFAYNRNYYFLLIIGLTLTSFGSTANPQLFALAREHAEKTQKETVMFSSVLRAQISLAWVIGPPLAFAIALGFSFKIMYVGAALAFLVCAMLSTYALPKIIRQRNINEKVEAPRQHRKSTLMLFIACTLMWSSNCIYLINMPLYVAHELHLPEKLAGIMMGTAAGLEIPTMLIAGYFSKRFFKRSLMTVSLVAGVIFYLLLTIVTNATLLLVIQILNAIYIGILAGIGMIYFQDLLPNQAGTATTLYSNASRCGWIIAGSVAGVIAEFWGYHAVFYVALCMTLLAIICLYRVKKL